LPFQQAQFGPQRPGAVPLAGGDGTAHVRTELVDPTLECFSRFSHGAYSTILQ
jgi:hypothetical protein